MATITLAICARNAERIIGTCLESVRNQTVAPDQVVVAVDELSDPTADVARSYGARVLESKATGLYEARNAVLEACTTDYLAFTDADCVLVPEWVALAKAALDSDELIAAGTGRHPPVGTRNFASWLHHMWFIVETESTGETQGIIGGNSYFRTSALREVGGWLKLPGHSAAEDVYIATALRKAGHRIWFEEGAAVQHHYETRLKGLMRKAVMMGKDITVMMRAAGWRDGLWYYTLAIPILAAMLPAGLLLAVVAPIAGISVALTPLLLTLGFLLSRFRSLTMAIPRWAARWIVIWPYSWGIVKGLFTTIPESARRTTSASAGAILLVCSHGGHLTEMLQLKEAFAGHRTVYFCYDAETTRRLPGAYRVPNMAKNPVEFVKNLARVRTLFKRERPSAVVSTGAEIAIPVLVIAKLSRVPMLYIECGAQVTTPSFTGKIMSRFADEFYVQWPELVAAYGGRARYAGSLIDETAPEGLDGDTARA